MEKNLKTLAAYLGRQATKINQAVGHSLYLRPHKGAPKMSEEQRQALRKVKTECGVCVATHAANHFGTKLHRVSIKCTPHNTYLNRYLTDKILNVDVKPPRMVLARDYADGIKAIYDILMQGRNFAKWRQRHRKYEIINAVANYLCEKCDAPPNCFGVNNWPRSDRGASPKEVFQTAHRLNFA